MKRIYLVGFMGVGKSTAGKKLASRLGWKFIDTDAKFENKYRLSIDTFFNKYGEELFRKLENDILISTFDLDNYVISTGGGMPCYSGAMQQINANGVSVYLEMSELAITSRLINSKQKRPLVMNLSEEELVDFIHNKLSERSTCYSQANIIVPALSIDIDLLVGKLSSYAKASADRES